MEFPSVATSWGWGRGSSVVNGLDVDRSIWISIGCHWMWMDVDGYGWISFLSIYLRLNNTAPNFAQMETNQCSSYASIFSPMRDIEMIILVGYNG
jgi:hypothetical protein